MNSLLRASRVAAFGWLAWNLATQAATYSVGSSRAYQTVASLPALAPGDIVEIDPATYNEVKRWTKPGTAANPILIRGVGASRPVFDATGENVDGALPHPRAVFQIEADYIVVENLEFRNARNGDNGAGIRVTGANNVTIRNCKITACDMGMMSDHSANLLIDRSEIASNGTPLYDGYSHNFYLGGNNTTVRFCYIHDSLNGQNFKTRGHYTELLYNYIADSQDGEIGLVDASETAAPNSHAVMIGNIVLSKPRLSGYNSGRFIQFGQDSGGAHNGTLFAFNNTFIAGDSRIQFLSVNASGSRIISLNNIFYGSDKIIGTLGGGIAGSNNWTQSTANAPATFLSGIQGSDPGFINRLARNVHLTALSGGRDRGMNVLGFLDGTGLARSGLPVFEYVNHLQNRARPDDGHIDIGAYEYSAPLINWIKVQGSDCLVSFTSTTGDQYDLQRSRDLTTRAWTPVVTNLLGTDMALEVTDTNGVTQSQAFYRIKASL